MPCNAVGMFESSRVTNKTLGLALAPYMEAIEPVIFDNVVKKAEALGVGSIDRLKAYWRFDRADSVLVYPMESGLLLKLEAGRYGLSVTIRGGRSSAASKSVRALVVALTEDLEALAGAFLGEKIAEALGGKYQLEQDIVTPEGARVLTVNI